MRVRLILSALSLPGLAPAPFPRPDRDDARKLQGAWVRIIPGLPGGRTFVTGFQIEIAPGRLTYGPGRGRPRTG